MVNIPLPKGKTEYKCICGEIENMKHFYNCTLLSESLDETIFNGTIKNQIDVFRIVTQNLDQRQIITSEMNFPCDPNDPLYSVME